MGEKNEFKQSVVLFLLQFIVFLIIYSTFSILYGKAIGENSEIKMLIKRLCQLTLYVLFIVFIHVNNDVSFDYKFTFNPAKFIISVVFVFSIFIAYQSSFDVLINKYLSLGIDLSEESDMFKYVVPVVIQTCITAPIAEELIVRGYLFRILSSRCSLKTAIMMSSLFFAVLHFDFFNTIFYVLMGIALCLIYIKTNSLLNSIIVHSMVNMTAVISYYKGYNLSFANVNIGVFLISLFIVVISYFGLQIKINT